MLRLCRSLSKLALSQSSSKPTMSTKPISNPTHFTRQFQDTSVSTNYCRLSPLEKAASIPPQNGLDHKSFLTLIGRKCSSVSDKFTSWEHLFKATSSELEDLGVNLVLRKHILRWREFYKRGIALTRQDIPKRRKIHLKKKAKANLAKKVAQGLA